MSKTVIYLTEDALFDPPIELITLIDGVDLVQVSDVREIGALSVSAGFFVLAANTRLQGRALRYLADIGLDPDNAADCSVLLWRTTSVEDAVRRVGDAAVDAEDYAGRGRLAQIVKLASHWS